jgi:hypothetical protein
LAGVKALSAVGILSTMLAVLCTATLLGDRIFPSERFRSRAIRYRWPAWATALAQAFELPKQFRRLGVRDRSAEAKARGVDEPAIIGPAPVTGSPPAQSASASPGLLRTAERTAKLQFPSLLTTSR